MSTPAAAVPRYRAWPGPAVLAAGFRPFFLLMGIWGAVAVPLWLAVLQGWIVIPTAFDPVAWHGHEMVFGLAQAAVAGFLLTAVPNWTGRMPLQGWSLAAMAGLFVLGRGAVAVSGSLGAAALVADLAFPLALLAVLLREIVAGRNWRNLPMLAALGLLGGANLLTHLEAQGWAETGAFGLRLGIAVLTALIALVGGRIIPSFTRNWLAKRGAARLPAVPGRFDLAVVLLTVAALLTWAGLPQSMVTTGLCALAAIVNLVRLARWRGAATLREPLLWVLHLGYLWVPVGLGLLALAAAGVALPPSAALHAITGGAIATMILAVSTRATLGHTGRELHAGPGTLAIYVLVTLAAVARVGAGLEIDAASSLITASGIASTLAFALFVAIYGRMLTTRRARSE